MSCGKGAASLTINSYEDRSALHFSPPRRMCAVERNIQLNIIINVHQIKAQAESILKITENFEKGLTCANNTTDSNCKEAVERVKETVTESIHALTMALATRKQKRGIRILGELLQDIAGVGLEEDQEKIINGLKQLNEQQTGLNGEMTVQKQLFTEAFDQFKELSTHFNNYTSMLNKKLDDQDTQTNLIKQEIVTNELQRAANLVGKKVDAITEIFSHKKISGKLIKLDDIEKLYMAQEEKLTNEHFPYENAWELITESEVKVFTQKGLLMAAIDMPVCSPGAWCLQTITTSPVIEDDIVTIAEPKFNAVGWSIHHEATLINTATCKITNQKKPICPIIEKVAEQDDGSCIPKILNKESEFEHCNDISLHRSKLVKTTTFRVSPNTIIIAPIKPTTIEALCVPGEKRTIRSPIIIVSEEFCKIKIDKTYLYLTPTTIEKEKIKSKSEKIIIRSELMKEPAKFRHNEEMNVEKVEELANRIKENNNHKIEIKQLDLETEQKLTHYFGGSTLIILAIIIIMVVVCCIRRF